MPESLVVLEERRQQLYQQLPAIGDFRPGNDLGQLSEVWAWELSVRPDRSWRVWSAVLVEHEAAGEEPGTESAFGPELEKVEQEVANYRRFIELCRELVQVNEQICRTRRARSDR